MNYHESDLPEPIPRFERVELERLEANFHKLAAAHKTSPRYMTPAEWRAYHAWLRDYKERLATWEHMP
ncbi:MAG: hypothetical protein RBU30_11905 [Polyangia bacterium]|nr:hypothetical protein [Polyangia bacterium]